MEESAGQRTERGEEGQEEPPGDVDAMGQDKRRPVVGQQYGASVRKQLTIYGIFLAVVAALAIGFFTIVTNVDNREIPLEDTAPWTEAGAVQTAPRDIDFPRNGPQDTIPEDEIGRAVPPDVSDEVSGG